MKKFVKRFIMVVGLPCFTSMANAQEDARMLRWIRPLSK